KPGALVATCCKGACCSAISVCSIIQDAYLHSLLPRGPELRYSQREKFWCKELSDLECRTIVQSSPAAGRNSLNPPNARVSLEDLGIGWISVSMTELRVEDSGIYWCGVSDHMKIIPLKKIKVAVSYEGELQISEEQGQGRHPLCMAHSVLGSSDAKTASSRGPHCEGAFSEWWQH
uniref:Immunoglobulin V-set domain-containing protein n=1 Tax=Gopherus agassizii TaxID=38772 RepID=A0A452HFI4_9SAUR